MAEVDQLRAQRGADPRGGVVAPDDEDRVPAAEGVGHPCPRGHGLGLVDRAGFDEPAVPLVGLQRIGIPLAQSKRRTTSQSAENRRTSPR
ncbi:hypothetical protein ACFQH9_28145 [Pseudonocardia lutea]|uniref:Uncharacterized protein n=1 Tax=Pseudonocardia lutea TaxID=2172015 RepID=A0ABW1IH50_9PSEU